MLIPSWFVSSAPVDEAFLIHFLTPVFLKTMYKYAKVGLGTAVIDFQEFVEKMIELKISLAKSPEDVMATMMALAGSGQSARLLCLPLDLLFPLHPNVHPILVKEKEGSE